MAPGSAQRAAVILHTESSVGFGGQELRIVAESRWLAAHGWSVVVVGQPASPLVTEARAAGLTTLTLEMSSALDVWAGLRLRRLMRDRGVGLVHTHSSVDSWLAGLAGRSLGVAVVRSRHVTIPIPRRRALVYRLPHRVITSGQAVRAIV